MNMIKVRKLTEEQASQLTGKLAPNGAYYHPIKNIDGDWCLSEQETSQIEFEWMITLPIINWEPPIPDETLIAFDPDSIPL